MCELSHTHTYSYLFKTQITRVPLDKLKLLVALHDFKHLASTDTVDGRFRLNIEKMLLPTERHTLTSKNTVIFNLRLVYRTLVLSK